jgi:DNA polymerase II small subunit/DNA polymerase delta subunit B
MRTFRKRPWAALFVNMTPLIDKDWETVRLRIKMMKDGGQLKIFLEERVVLTYANLSHYLDQLPEDILLVIEPANSVP